MRISDWSSDVCSSDLLGQLALFHCAVTCLVGGMELLDFRFGRNNGGFELFRPNQRVPDHPPFRHDIARAVLFVESLHVGVGRSEEHTSELQSLMRISYAVFCLKKKKKT